MHRSKYAILAGLASVLVVILAATFSILNSSIEKAPVLPTQMLLPTAEVDSNQLAANGVTATPRQVVQDESLATTLPLPTTTPPLSIPTARPPSMTEPLPMSMPQEPVANQVVIHFVPDTSPQQRAAYIHSFGGTIQQEIDALQTVVVHIPAEANIPTSLLVVDSEPDYYVTALIDVPTSDIYYPDQWALTVIGAPEAWSSVPDDAPDVIVAVIDSGVCLDHPDLQGEILAGYDFVQDDSIPQDDFGHGCGVAGIIAANIDNGLGIAGVAPNAQIMPLRVLDGNGLGTYSDVAAAIVRAVDDGAGIINLSLGGINTSTTLQNAIDYAIAQDVLVIAAAGNTGGSVLYPAAYDPVVAVASVDSDLQISGFSSRGAEIDLLAPGRNILTTTNGSSYTNVSGTSFSAPHVTGVAALEIALGNTLTINGGIVSVNGSFIQQPTPVPTEPTPDDVVKPLPKVSHDLAALLTEYQAFQAQAQGADVSFAATNIFMPLRNELVVIDATSSGDPNILLADLQALGLQKGAVASYLVSGLLPINSISSLPTLDSLRFVNPAYYITNGGAITNQGDRAAQADIARATYGLTGSGIRIGILSNSFDCENTARAGDIASGDLPSGIIILEDGPCSNEELGITQLVPDGAPGTSQTFHTSSGIPSAIAPGDDEGRGIGQVIHDVAPGASQAFHAGVLGQANFAQGIRDLAAAGATVITDDIIYLDEPMFQDGPIAQAVNQVVAMGIPYFSSAGNDARQSFESGYRSSEICGEAIIVEACAYRHDFNPGAAVDDRQSVTIPTGESVQIVLQWDQPFFSVSGSSGSASDLGIYLYNSGGTLVASADDPNVGNNPVEFLEYTNNSPGESFQLAIQLNEGPAPARMKYVYFNDQMTVDEFATHSSTIYGHPNAAGAEAVGAAFFYDTPRYGTDPSVLEAFSSWGGTPILFNISGNRLASPITREKPEIVAPDGGNTTFFGSPDIPSGFDDPDNYPNFFGTSASAPLAAAAAALMLEYDSSLTPAEVYYYMETTAHNMGTLGFDYASGYGLIDVNAILAALPAPGMSDSPANAAPPRNYYTTSTPTLTWNRVTWAAEYEIQVDTAKTFNAPLNFTVPATTLEIAPTSLPDGHAMYYWRVRAKKGNANGPWSAVDSFVVDVP
jgi:subtilisin family serine protease